MDYLSSLPTDLVFQLLTYLSFDDVINLCQSNRKFHFICTNYKNRWKSLIDNTYEDIYDYQEKLNKIQSKLSIDGYNYLVYVNLIKLLDPVTQSIIYYKQDDMESFKRFEDEHIFLAIFLLNKPNEMRKYKPYFYTKPYYLLLKEEIPNTNDLNCILPEMAAYGNVHGVKYILENGANIHYDNDIALRRASETGHLDVVKYLIENEADIHGWNDKPLRSASYYGHLDVVKYLVENGANIHVNNDSPLRKASETGRLDVVKYLVERGANIRAGNDAALFLATENKHIHVIKYLTEQGSSL